MKLDGKECLIPGHTNRVFAAKYSDRTLVTSGWDQRVIFWDL